MKNLIIVATPSENVKKEISLISDNIENVCWLTAEQYHITLTFIGEVEDMVAEKIAKVLSNIDMHSFETNLEGVGTFRNESKGITFLWAGVKDAELVLKLRDKINSILQENNFSYHVRTEFNPHLTMSISNSSDKRIYADFVNKNKEYKSGKFNIDKFIIYDSKGGDFDRIYNPYSIIKLNNNREENKE